MRSHSLRLLWRKHYVHAAKSLVCKGNIFLGTILRPSLWIDAKRFRGNVTRIDLPRKRAFYHGCRQWFVLAGMEDKQSIVPMPSDTFTFRPHCWLCMDLMKAIPMFLKCSPFLIILSNYASHLHIRGVGHARPGVLIHEAAAQAHCSKNSALSPSLSTQSGRVFSEQEQETGCLS